MSDHYSPRIVLVSWCVLITCAMSQIPKRVFWRARPWMQGRAVPLREPRSSSFPARDVVFVPLLVFAFLHLLPLFRSAGDAAVLDYRYSSRLQRAVLDRPDSAEKEKITSELSTNGEKVEIDLQGSGSTSTRFLESTTLPAVVAVSVREEGSRRTGTATGVVPEKVEHEMKDHSAQEEIEQKPSLQRARSSSSSQKDHVVEEDELALPVNTSTTALGSSKFFVISLAVSSVVSLSRILLGSHFFSDCIFGYGLGVAAIVIGHFPASIDSAVCNQAAGVVSATTMPPNNPEFEVSSSGSHQLLAIAFPVVLLTIFGLLGACSVHFRFWIKAVPVLGLTTPPLLYHAIADCGSPMIFGKRSSSLRYPPPFRSVSDPADRTTRSYYSETDGPDDEEQKQRRAAQKAARLAMDAVGNDVVALRESLAAASAGRGGKHAVDLVHTSSIGTRTLPSQGCVEQLALNQDASALHTLGVLGGCALLVLLSFGSNFALRKRAHLRPYLFLFFSLCMTAGIGFIRYK
ncbi:unnamed protein product [Amoebophrya sp. A25]|nr:unnamed protein product [Amoebophrya sp. A25]|eukprot:GSA25T00026749001.1